MKPYWLVWAPHSLCCPPSRYRSERAAVRAARRHARKYHETFCVLLAVATVQEAAETDWVDGATSAHVVALVKGKTHHYQKGGE
jgi:hypothetical protein